MEYLLLSITVWLTYFYSIKSSFVIDDTESYSTYDGKLQAFKYGDIAKWLRYHICGGNFPSRHSYQEGKPIPMGRVPFGHHTLSIVIFNLAILAVYPALAHLIGSQLALFTLLLYVVHPISTQAVAWISGIGYSLALLWMGLTLDLILYVKPTTPELSMAVFVVFCILQFLMVNALMSTATFCVILLFLGFPTYSIISAGISLLLGLDIIKETHKTRKKVFDDQNMSDSSKFSLRKIVTVFQTMGYYMYLTLLPIKMGLYHVWGYHYNKELERLNWRFWLGLCVTIAMVWLLITQPFPIKLAVLIYLCTFLPFSNFITVQQFIAERYVFIPTLGTCIFLSYFFGESWIYPIIFGMYIMRTWCHLPTYDNEIKYYQSNIWNFPNSEVAYGNLGCVWLKMGKTGTALDAWHMSRNINKDYDVPNYNIFSSHKASAMGRLANGDLVGAIETLKSGEPFLKQCLSSSICHFKDGWQKEYDEISEWISNPYSLLKVERKRLDDLKEKLKKEAITPTIQASLDDIEVRLSQITKVEESQKCPPNVLSEVKVSSAATLESSTPKPTV